MVELDMARRRHRAGPGRTVSARHRPPNGPALSPNPRPETLELESTQGALWGGCRCSSGPITQALPLGCGPLAAPWDSAAQTFKAQKACSLKAKENRNKAGLRWMHLPQVLPASVQHRAPCGSRRYCLGAGSPALHGAPLCCLERKTRSINQTSMPRAVLRRHTPLPRNQPPQQ